MDCLSHSSVSYAAAATVTNRIADTTTHVNLFMVLTLAIFLEVWPTADDPSLSPPAASELPFVGGPGSLGRPPLSLSFRFLSRCISKASRTPIVAPHSISAVSTSAHATPTSASPPALQPIVDMSKISGNDGDANMTTSWPIDRLLSHFTVPHRTCVKNPPPPPHPSAITPETGGGERARRVHKTFGRVRRPRARERGNIAARWERRGAAVAVRRYIVPFERAGSGTAVGRVHWTIRFTVVHKDLKPPVLAEAGPDPLQPAAVLERPCLLRPSWAAAWADDGRPLLYSPHRHGMALLESIWNHGPAVCRPNLPSRNRKV